MIRWLRMTAAALVVVAVLGLGAIVGLLLVQNSGYVPVRAHPWLEPLVEPMIGKHQLEIQLPVLLAGWLLAILTLGSLLIGSMYYVWRRRQYESLVERLERELVRLRNLPVTEPTPLEDLPEVPDPELAQWLATATGVLPGDLAGNLAGNLAGEPGAAASTAITRRGKS